MSYLTGPRLNFTGKFIADVSTVNNFPANFDRERYTKADYDNWDIGYWNPYGTGVWRLTDCAVTGAVLGDGTRVADDAVLGMAVADADDQPPAKMVDLDSEQQMVSAIWGLMVRLVGKDGANLLRSDFAVASFTDLWTRSWAQDPSLQYPLHPPSLMGACWQSVLTNLSWGDVSGSPFLTQLKAAAQDGLLSIKFNVYGFNAGYGVFADGVRHLPNPPGFTTGLLTGSIGVARKGEPQHYTLGRRLMPDLPKDPRGRVDFYYPNIVLNEARKTLAVDLGNSIPFRTWQGAMVDDALLVGYLDAKGAFQALGEVKPDNAWYEQTAGIVDLPLSDAQLAAVADSPLAVRNAVTGKTLAQEPEDGKAVRADQFVYRLAPGDQASVDLWATQFGRPLAGAAIDVAFDNSGLQPADNAPVGTPESALKFPGSVTTDAKGFAQLTLTAGDPGTPRAVDDIDGQVYGVRPTLAGAKKDSYTNDWDYISVLVWSGYEIPEAPTWEKDIKPILTQYANLYPVMLPVLDMGDYDSVKKHLYSLNYAMSLPEENPNYMPAVRDLSPNKKAAVLKWCIDPVRGEPAEASVKIAEAPAAQFWAVAAPDAGPAPAEDAPHPARILKK